MHLGQLWTAIETIEDTLARGKDLQAALQKGVMILLEALDRPGAALFLPRFCEHISVDWTCINTPESWRGKGCEPTLQIAALAQQVIDRNKPAASDFSLNLAGGLPVGFEDGASGALLMAGPEPLSEAEVEAAQRLLRPFARLVSIHTAASGCTDGDTDYLELMRSRDTLRTMFDSLPISIYIIDGSYNLMAVNSSRSNRVSSQPSQLVGRKCYEAFYGRSQPCEGCRVAETFARGLNTTRIERNRLVNDIQEEWEISTFPIFDEQARIVQAIVVGQDVTEKRNLEVNLRQSEKLAAVGQLAAGVAHEINNPLTAIIANAQLLRQEIPPENKDLLDSVKLIEVAGSRASQAVRNLLGFARKGRYELEPVDLNTTIHNALTLVQHELVGRPITVQMELSDDMPLVSASQDQLQSVWINLLLNAIDAIDKDPGIITITSNYTGSQFEVTITDNGMGIPPDQISKVFEPFFTTKSTGRGTGLGLSVCMRAVRLHGGTLQIDSQQGEWSRFLVSLPGPR